MFKADMIQSHHLDWSPFAMPYTARLAQKPLIGTRRDTYTIPQSRQQQSWERFCTTSTALPMKSGSMAGKFETLGRAHKAKPRLEAQKTRLSFRLHA